MGVTTPVAFDPNPENLGLVVTFKAGTAILAGQVVAFADAGTDYTVIPALSTVGTPAGVALASQATVGGPVPVAMNGCVVTVMCAATDTSIDAGHFVSVDSAVPGTVIEFDPALAANTATTDVGIWPIGYTIEDTTAGGGTVGSTVPIVINVTPIFTAHA